jgi:hypothetical protein
VEILKEKDLNQDFFKDKKKSVTVTQFIFETGDIIKTGDTITLGEPSGINANKYGNGAKYLAYDFMIYGTNTGSVFSGVKHADTNVKDKQFKIVKMIALIGMGATALSSTIEPVGHSMMIYKSIFVTNIVRAIASREILLSKRLLSKDEALKILEEKKKLLDLQLITQDEFNKAKNELAPIILKN